MKAKKKKKVSGSQEQRAQSGKERPGQGQVEGLEWPVAPEQEMRCNLASSADSGPAPRLLRPGFQSWHKLCKAQSALCGARALALQPLLWALSLAVQPGIGGKRNVLY